VFAVDSSADSRSQKVASAISKGIGTGKVASLDHESARMADWCEIFSLNLYLKPSQCILPKEEEDEEEEEVEVDDEDDED